VVPKRWRQLLRPVKRGYRKVYYTNGNLKTVNTYVNGVLNGPVKAYYKSGALKEAGVYVNGKTDGPYKIITNWRSICRNGFLERKG